MVTRSWARKNRRHERDIQHASDHRPVDRTYLGDPVAPLTHHFLGGERGNALLRGTAHRVVHLQRQKRLRAQCSRRILQFRSDPGARLGGRHGPRLHGHFVARIFHHLGGRLHRQHRDPNPRGNGCFPPGDVPLPTHPPAASLRSADSQTRHYRTSKGTTTIGSVYESTRAATCKLHFPDAGTCILAS